MSRVTRKFKSMDTLEIEWPIEVVEEGFQRISVPLAPRHLFNGEEISKEEFDKLLEEWIKERRLG